jgi:hypothetical protein
MNGSGTVWNLLDYLAEFNAGRARALDGRWHPCLFRRLSCLLHLRPMPRVGV